MWVGKHEGSLTGGGTRAVELGKGASLRCFIIFCIFPYWRFPLAKPGKARLHCMDGDDGGGITNPDIPKLQRRHGISISDSNMTLPSKFNAAFCRAWWYKVVAQS